jgi:hypothetical protein
LRMPILTVSLEKESAANAEPAGDATAVSALQTASAAQAFMTHPPSRPVACLGDPPLPRLPRSAPGLNARCKESFTHFPVCEVRRASLAGFCTFSKLCYGFVKRAIMTKAH